MASGNARANAEECRRADAERLGRHVGDATAAPGSLAACSSNVLMNGAAFRQNVLIRQPALKELGAQTAAMDAVNEGRAATHKGIEPHAKVRVAHSEGGARRRETSNGKHFSTRRGCTGGGRGGCQR